MGIGHNLESLFDPAAFPMGTMLSAEFQGTSWQGTLTYEGRAYDLVCIQSIYVRRSNHYQVQEGLPEIVQGFLDNEANRGFGGILMSLNCLWIAP
jgi:hypothetical protein